METLIILMMSIIFLSQFLDIAKEKDNELSYEHYTYKWQKMLE